MKRDSCYDIDWAGAKVQIRSGLKKEKAEFLLRFNMFP